MGWIVAFLMLAKLALPWLVVLVLWTAFCRLDAYVTRKALSVFRRRTHLLNDPVSGQDESGWQTVYRRGNVTIDRPVE